MGTQSWEIIKVNQEATRETDEVAEEYPLTVVVNHEEFATMVCTPTNLEELVIGFLASDGIILKMEDLVSLHIDDHKGFAYVETGRTLQTSSSGQKRWIGSCCGKSRAFYFQNDAMTARTIMNHFVVPKDRCLSLMEEFQASAEMFQRTGGVHQAAIATRDHLEVAFTDIGRHNALDKLFGYMLKHKESRKEKLIIFSGRISSEVLLKVSKMGIGFMLSKSAPTDLALELADDLNITAAGFVRGERMNIYTHPERVEIEQVYGSTD